MYFNRLWISHKVSWVGWAHRLAYLMETSDVCTMNYDKVPLLGGLTEIGHVALVADTETNILVPYTETEILSYQRNFATRSCHNAASDQNVVNIMTFMLNGSIIVTRHYKNRKENNIQVRHYWPFYEGNPLTKGQQCGTRFHGVTSHLWDILCETLKRICFLTKSSPMAALEVVKMTISGTACDETLIEMTFFSMSSNVANRAIHFSPLSHRIKIWPDFATSQVKNIDFKSCATGSRICLHSLLPRRGTFERTAQQLKRSTHYNDVIMSAMASQITGVSILCSTVCSGSDQRKNQSSASLAFMRGLHRWPVNSPLKRSGKRKMFQLDDVIMTQRIQCRMSACE